jgi:hypothetical protein
MLHHAACPVLVLRAEQNDAAVTADAGETHVHA